MIDDNQTCPCGSDTPFAACCQQLINLREIAVAFYQPGNRMQPYSMVGNWVDLNELDKFDASAYRRDLGMTIREILEEAKKWQR